MASTDELIEFWNEFEGKSDQDGHYVHPADQPILSTFLEKKTKSDFEYLSTGGLKTALLPGPFQGDLQNAKIIVCMLNPGVGLDSLHEVAHKALREAMLRQIRQEFNNTNYKFLGLDPAFCWAGGFGWWSRKFSPLIKKLMCPEKSTVKALKLVSDHVAAVELFAYPSKSFSSVNLVTEGSELPSTIKMKSWIRHKAKEGAHIIIVRGLQHWSPVCGENVHVMASNYARGGWFLNKKNAPKYADIILNDLQAA